MDSLGLSNVFNILSRIAFGSVIVLPLSLSNYNLSHQEGISLKYSKTAPPLAIFDDERISQNIEELALPNTKKEPLLVNRLQTRKMALKIARKFASLQKESQKTAAPKREIRSLAGLSLQKNSPNVVAIKQVIVEPTRTVQLKVAQITKPKVIAINTPPPQLNKTRVAYQETVIATQPRAQDTQKFVAGLDARLRDRIEEVENFDDVLNEDYAGDSFEARASALVAQETANRNTQEYKDDLAKDITTGVTSINRVSSRKSFSQRMNEAAKRSPGTKISNNFGRSGYTKGSSPSAPTGNTPVPKETEVPHDENLINDKSSEKGVSIASRGLNRQVLISGSIEMTKGLAYTGTQSLVVYRQIGGTKYGYGQVIIEQGRYEIYVEEPNSGVVIAELIDNDSMIGRAEILMPEVMLKAKTQEDLKNVPIKLEPILDQVVAENISAYSYMKKEKVKNSQVHISGMVDGNTKIFNSSIILKTEKENHWGNILLGSSKQMFTNILNPDATMKALIDILGIRTAKNETGIIKGEISIFGNTVAGAQVEVIGSDEEALKPVYFNSFLPDTALSETTANGQYALVGLNQGSYLVRAKYKGKYLSPQVVPVEPGYVTQVQFDVQKPSLAEAFIFDIQTSEMMSAEINFLGSEQRVPVQSRKLISFSGSSGIQFLEVQAQDQNYFATRMTVDKSEKEILIPMISQEWLNGLLSRLRITSIPDTGLIIGTAQELPYTVELDPNAYNEDTKIVYFDAQGKLVPGATITPQGGGFVAVNVNQGIRSLFNKYHGTKNLKITTMAVDNSAVNVFNSKF